MMSKYGELRSDNSIRFVRDLPGPIERVWAYLTEPEKRARWLASGETASEIGGDAEYKFDNLSLTPHEETVPEKYQTPENPDQRVSFTGKVVAYDPPRLLQTTWPDDEGGDTMVTYRLAEKSGRVELEIIHEHITKPDHRIGALAGWHVHMDILKAVLEDRVPEPFWDTHTRLEQEYAEKA